MDEYQWNVKEAWRNARGNLVMAEHPIRGKLTYWVVSCSRNRDEHWLERPRLSRKKFLLRRPTSQLRHCSRSVGLDERISWRTATKREAIITYLSRLIWSPVTFCANFEIDWCRWTWRYFTHIEADVSLELASWALYKTNYYLVVRLLSKFGLI